MKQINPDKYLDFSQNTNEAGQEAVARKHFHLRQYISSGQQNLPKCHIFATTVG